MNLKDPEKEFFNDFEHKVTDKMKKYADRVDFPKVEDYGITRMELDDYLFDKQAILDMAFGQIRLIRFSMKVEFYVEDEFYEITSHSTPHRTAPP